MKQPNFLIIGAGSRGSAYARAISTSTPGRIGAVAEPNPYKRRALGQNYIWGERDPKGGEEFEGWEQWIEYETKRRQRHVGGETGVDGVLICTLDETHIIILSAIAKANLLDLHVLCEKPLALSLDDCLSVYAAWTKSDSGERVPPKSIFSIGHVLRYSPHNLLLRRLVRAEQVVGEIVSVEHAEPVGYWHFAHSYVRGNWRRETEKGDGSLLTKSCHDVDFLVWLVEAPINPAAGEDGSERRLSLRTVSSTGYLTQFVPSRKPAAAGSATNCTTCPIERDCTYSAIRIYRDNQLNKGETGWPVNIVCPDIEDHLPSNDNSNSNNYGQPHRKANGPVTTEAESHLLSVLGQDYTETTDDDTIKQRPWYGRCVYESDNDVVDDQVVTLAWDVVPSTTTTTTTPPIQSNNRKTTKTPGVTALFHMIAPTEAQCVRRGRIYGTKGEITYDSSSISIYDFASGNKRTIHVPKQPPEEAESHGGGDYGLARGFVGAVEAVINKGWSVEKAQREFVGCALEEVVKSHAVVFAAEESRRAEEVVRWERWWRGKLKVFGLD
ncbi:hypothetical protein ASPSYDRAFT_198587 [Aspergillus sydowii CBS 593.65]|uniref:Gfo/Idh/MocA-like oxidoreductase N-terminal domain-containing protein n=1 Tax=Aspergillus sydowii CBS 593.65 TaxID=1036612 RepID=A0A1L9TN90_9EURO|nr:uncharacterized protein ASPSYDRAFT_198587 [Aspergillus sydowii CBS 593.65]OJJ60919.1 hypothetical protein ASPSYDRAFT_198587 [Aspergillus sydowii CBS 593.65]